jgi:hypothetical protein
MKLVRSGKSGRNAKRATSSISEVDSEAAATKMPSPGLWCFQKIVINSRKLSPPLLRVLTGEFEHRDYPN